MFEILKNAPPRDALPAGHHAIQILRQWRKRVMARSDPFALEGDRTLTAQQIEIVRRIIGEIEEHERVRVDQIPDANALAYLLAIADALQEWSRPRLGADLTRGRNALSQLRQGVPPPEFVGSPAARLSQPSVARTDTRSLDRGARTHEGRASHEGTRRILVAQDSPFPVNCMVALKKIHEVAEIAEITAARSYLELCEALEVSTYDAVIVDVDLPYHTGEVGPQTDERRTHWGYAAIERVLQTLPATRVLVLSRYADILPRIAEKFGLQAQCAVMPLSSEALSERVREMLSQE